MFAFALAMEKLVRDISVELTTPPALLLPDWDAVADGSRPFYVYCDAFIDGFGAALEQEQADGPIKSIAYISRATLDLERHWTPLDLEAGSIVWALKRFRGYVCGTKFRIFSDRKALESIGKLGDHTARVQRWLEFLTAFNYTLEYRKGSPNGNADFLSRMPEPATEHDRNGSTSPTPVKDGLIYLIRACGLHNPSSPIPGVGLDGIMPRTESNALGGLPFTPADVCVFRAHGPRMRLDDVSGPSRRFLARVSASVATVDGSPGRGWASRTADNDSASGFAVPTAVSEGSARASATTTSVVQPTPSRSSVQETDLVKPADPTASVSNSPGFPASQTMTQYSDRVYTWMRRRSTTAAGNVSPAVDYGFGPGGAPRPSFSRVTTPPRASRSRQAPPAAVIPALLADSPVRTVPLPPDRDHAEPMGIPLLRLTPSSGDMPTAPTGSDALGDAAELRLADSVARYSHTDWNREQHAGPTYYAAMLYISTGRPSVLPPDVLACYPSHKRPSLSDIQELRVKADYIQPTMTSSCSSVTRHRRRQGLTNPTLWGEPLAY